MNPAGRAAFEAGRALWWPHRLDFPALEACADALAGTHDFTDTRDFSYNRETATTTAEYAVGTMAAVAFAAVPVRVLQSSLVATTTVTYCTRGTRARMSVRKVARAQRSASTRRWHRSIA